LRLNVDSVAERHAKIVVVDQRAVMTAIDPSTWVNDGPIRETALRNGDRLSIGPITFRVRLATADELAIAHTKFDGDSHGSVKLIETRTLEESVESHDFSVSPPPIPTWVEILPPPLPRMADEEKTVSERNDSRIQHGTVDSVPSPSTNDSSQDEALVPVDDQLWISLLWLKEENWSRLLIWN